MGCFKDEDSSLIAAIEAGEMVSFGYHETIQKCYEKALREGNSHFAVVDRECRTDYNLGATYAKYGRITGCKYGRGNTRNGRRWKMDVYEIIKKGKREKSDMLIYFHTRVISIFFFR